MNVIDRIKELPYGVSKTGFDVGFDVVEKDDLVLYLYPWTAWDGDVEKGTKKLKETFPGAVEIWFVGEDEDEQETPFWAIRFTEAELVLKEGVSEDE